MEGKEENTVIVGMGHKHTSKPDKREIISSKKAAVNNYYRISVDELAELVGNQGYSVVPSLLYNKVKVTCMSQDDFLSCQLFMIDFDGLKYDDKKKKYTGRNVSFEGIKKRADDCGLPIAFAYRTLRCPDKKPYYKFRIAFIHDQTVRDKEIAKLIYKALGQIFPECDQACCEVSRMFLGGKELIYLNSNARVNLVQIIHSLYTALDKQRNLKRNLKNFISKNNIDIVIKNNLIVAGTVDMISAFDENVDSPNIVILKAESGFSSIFYLKKVKVGNVIDIHKDHTCRKHKSRLDLDQYKGICPLLDDYLASAARLSHMERFILLTNMSAISGGAELFYRILKADYGQDTYDKWMRDKQTMIRYHPASCCSHCRYYDGCCKKSNLPNIITKLKNSRHGVYEKDEHIEIRYALNPVSFSDGSKYHHNDNDIREQEESCVNTIIADTLGIDIPTEERFDFDTLEFSNIICN